MYIFERLSSSSAAFSCGLSLARFVGSLTSHPQKETWPTGLADLAGSREQYNPRLPCARRMINLVFTRTRPFSLCSKILVSQHVIRTVLQSLLRLSSSSPYPYSSSPPLRGRHTRRQRRAPSSFSPPPASHSHQPLHHLPPTREGRLLCTTAPPSPFSSSSSFSFSPLPGGRVGRERGRRMLSIQIRMPSNRPSLPPLIMFPPLYPLLLLLLQLPP